VKSSLGKQAHVSLSHDAVLLVIAGVVFEHSALPIIPHLPAGRDEPLHPLVVTPYLPQIYGPE